MTPYYHLERAVERIESATDAQLDCTHWWTDLVATVGLFHDGRPLYGSYQSAVAPLQQPGLWQHPEEFGPFLQFVYCNGFERILDLGCFHGFGAVLMVTAARQSNPHSTLIAADLNRWIPDPLPPIFHHIDYRPGTTSSDYHGEQFDLAWIDADHSYQSALADYQNLLSAPAVAFHDVADDYIAAVPGYDGGVKRLWGELSTVRPSIQYRRTDREPVMGIGVLI